MKCNLSVIVPVYNVEERLQRCIDSLASQTMESVEYLIIDDGSTDNSGVIVDRYKDFGFCVFHTENHGLSAARNLGIEKAQGDWIMFVDSDDWVEPDFCKIPYETAINNDADLVIFQNRTWKNGKLIDKISLSKRLCHQNKKRSMEIITPETAMELNETKAWNKLYKRSLFNGIRYPEGRVFEDVATTYKLIWKARKIVLVPEILYNYEYRQNSISQTRSLQYKKDGFISALERYQDLNRFHYPAEKHQVFLWIFAIDLLACSIPKEDMIDLTVKQAETIVNDIQGIPKELPTKKRIMLLVWRFNRRLFHIICRLFDRKDKDA